MNHFVTSSCYLKYGFISRWEISEVDVYGYYIQTNICMVHFWFTISRERFYLHVIQTVRLIVPRV